MATTISSITRNKNPFQLPRKYEFLNVLGEGGFGVVLKCLKKDTKDTVAVKIPRHVHNATNNKEVSMLQNLMRHNLDKCNIVKFYDWYEMTNGKALVFEPLDISLDKYIRYHHPICLSRIRTIIQQLATAFNALKSIGVIHTDLKPDNIMVVNRWTRPLRVKLIDFGLAMPTSESRMGMKLQTVYFRAPEIILGLPFSEAIDMWSLGGVLAAMILGFVLFPGRDEYQALQFIVELLGQPADELLKKGRKTNCYFNKTNTNGWRLMTPEEYWGENTQPHLDCRKYKFPSLNYLKEIRREERCDEGSDREKCTELLKAMLKVNEAERITPSEVLTHPFIAQDCHKSSNEASEAAAAQPQRIQTQIEKTMEKTVVDESTHGGLSSTSTQQPVSPIKPQPAAAMGNLQLDSHVKMEDQESTTSVVTHVNKTSSSTPLASLSEHADCDPPAPALKDDDTTNIQPDHNCRSPKISRTVVIMVRPATAENTVEMESDTSLQSGVSESSLEVSESDMSWISEDSTTSDDTVTTEEDEEEKEEEEEDKKKKKKKKNCFRRFFSWMKKNCCCWTCVEEDE